MREVAGRRGLERVASGVVGLGVQAAAPHEGAEGVGVGHEDDGVDEFSQRPAGVRSRKHQLLEGRGGGGGQPQTFQMFENRGSDVQTGLISLS